MCSSDLMLTEVISQWFTGGDWQKLAILAVILVTLGFIRVLAVRFSPAQPSHATPSQTMAPIFSSL